MTHNGQGDEPSAQPAREGVVLPSDGGEPLLPGQTGDRGTPAGGQTWGRPWGPGPAQQAPPETGQAGQGWTPNGEWNTAGADHGAQAPGWGPQTADGPGGAAQDSGATAAGWNAWPAGHGASAPDSGGSRGSGGQASGSGGQTSGWATSASGPGAQAQGWDRTASGPGTPGAPGAGAGAPGGSAEGAPGWGAAGPSSQYAEQSAQYGAQQGADPQWGGRQTPNGGGQLPPQTAGAGSQPQQQSGDAIPRPHEGAAMNGYGPPQTPGTHAAPQGQAGSAESRGSGGYGFPHADGAQPQPGGYGAPQGQAGQAAPLPSAARHAAPQGQAHGQWQEQGQGGSVESRGSGGYGFPHADGAQPPSGAHGASQASGGRGAPLPPVDAGAGSLPHAAPMDEGATQYLPPVAVAAPADEGATQYLPPVGPGALPPETPSDGMTSGATPSESTQYLGQVRQDGRPGPMPGGPGAGPMPPVADPDAQPTQFIAPVPARPGPAPYGIRPGGPEERQQPPAEFDNLFRADAADAAGSTQQMPRFVQPGAGQGGAPGYRAPGHPGSQGHPAAPGAPGSPDGPAGRGARRGAADGDNGRGGRTRSRVPLIAAVGVGIAVLGIGAGALLSAGGGDDKSDENTTVAATAPAADDSASPSPSADPAKEQAVALDKLLADSGDSRDSVIRAVTDVRTCTNLGEAATNLRNAANQRNGLVTRLAALPVDKLPNNAQLTAALNSAWKASASADTHYAAWADQVAGKKGCPKGKARTTGQTQAGNRESGTATTEKAKAAKLWNSIAQTYGLTERQPTQL